MPEENRAIMRQREFDEAEVLDRALQAFWRLGYDACSISDLVEATGVHRQSLYNAYGDKRGLFLAVAARYRALSAQALEPLRGSDAGIAQLRRYFENFLRMLRANGCGGCLLVRTALSVASVDGEMRALIDAASDDVRSAFAGALENAVRNGDLPRETNVPAQAAYLFCVLHGLTALAQTGASQKQVTAAMSQAFAHLG
jgi:TetR/AcrR family transcriptional repressor of nem operon